LVDNFYNQNKDSVCLNLAHVSTSSIGDAFSGDMFNAFNGAGLPTYVLGGVRMADWPPTESMFKNQAKKFFSSPISANIAFQQSIAGSVMTINTTTKVFQNISAGQVYVSASLLEKNVSYQHNSGSGNVTINGMRIQRTVAGTKTSFGKGFLWLEKLFTAPVTAGTTKDYSFSINLNSAWKRADLIVLVSVWLIDNATVSVLSCEDVASTVAIESKKDFTNLNGKRFVCVNKYDNSLKIKFPQMDGNDKTKSVAVINMQGKILLKKQYQDVDREIIMSLEHIPSGLYVVKSISGEKVFFDKVLIDNY